ncbi:hypothetical protein GF407_09975 [candidate division KSB1 bacterium]|nr:hypothetical protein [candidate division KSB1 bacterium]
MRKRAYRLLQPAHHTDRRDGLAGELLRQHGQQLQRACGCSRVRLPGRGERGSAARKLQRWKGQRLRRAAGLR